MTCHVFTVQKGSEKNWCEMKTESEFIAADVTFFFLAFFAFFLSWMAEFVIIRFIIEECESASSEIFFALLHTQHCNCATNRLFTENLSFISEMLRPRD